MNAIPSPERPGAAALFDAVADEYDQSGVAFFEPIAQGLVDTLAPVPGERVADLGCGRGAATLPLARAVRPGGRVVGLDISSRMLAHAREAVEREGLEVDLRLADVAEPGLPEGDFDVVASSLVLFFLPEPAAALARWVQLLAPGGRIGLATFGARHPVYEAVDDEFRPWLPPQLRDPRVVGADSPFASDEGMERLLAGAGADQVRTVTLRLPIRIDSVERWEAMSRGTGQRAMWANIPPEELAGLRARVADHLEQVRSPTGDFEVWQDIRHTLGDRPTA